MDDLISAVDRYEKLKAHVDEIRSRDYKWPSGTTERDRVGAITCAKYAATDAKDDVAKCAIQFVNKLRSEGKE